MDKMELNSGDADDYLSVDDKKELFSITKIIKDKTRSKDNSKKNMKDREVTPVINDVSIKRKLANFFLKIVSKTPKDDEKIQNTAYMMTGFVFYDFDNDLDAILDKAGDMEITGGQEAIKLLEVIKKDLENYVKKM